MAEPAGMKYVTVRAVNRNGVTAYQEGALVHESAVEGPDAWLTIGEDVRVRPGADIPRPPRTAPQSAWAAYAVSLGAAEADVADMSRTELIKTYGAAQRPGN